jgi:hypothetical protein
MRTLRRIRLGNVSNVAAGRTAIIDLPRGPRYHRVVIKYLADTDKNYTHATHGVTQIRVKANGSAFRTCTPADNEFFNQFFRARGDNNVTGGMVIGGVFAVDFAPLSAGRRVQAASLAIGTLDLGSLQIELDIRSGATAPSMVAWAEIEDVDTSSPLATSGELIRQSIQGIQIGGAGNLDIEQWPRDIEFLHLLRPAAGTNINGFVVDATVGANRIRVLEDDDAALSLYTPDYYGLGQTGLRVATFSREGLLTDGLPTRDANGRQLSALQIRVIAGGAVNTDLLFSGIGRIQSA